LGHIHPVDKERASAVGMILPLLVLALERVSESTTVIVSFE
jgi:hypothetical protein